jgi:hypothetical protein
MLPALRSGGFDQGGTEADPFDFDPFHCVLNWAQGGAAGKIVISVDGAGIVSV